MSATPVESPKKGLVIITGASSGIGRTTAQLFSSEGYPLLLIARRIEKVEALKLPNAICSKVDVADYKTFVAAVENAEKQFGPTHLIVNNAGVMLLGKMESQDPEEWKQMIDANIYGVLFGTKAVLKGMLERKEGTIINISSIAGRKAFPNHAVYTATKFAVHGLTENLRMEKASTGVRVIVVAPGVVETELLGHTSSAEIKDGYQKWKESSGKMLESIDVARVILFAFQQPKHVTLREIVIGPTAQEP